MKPAISIIVPVYNVEQYLEDCINSILSQKLKDFELLLINDGSSDKSGAICDFYSIRDPRIRVIHKNYGGVSSARNVGVKAAKGEFIGFVDGDDRVLPGMYEALFNLCIETGSDISVCRLGREIDGELINEVVDNEEIIELDTEEALRQMFKGVLYRFSLCNKLFKKDCFDNIKFPEGRIHEDLSTTYRLFANANRIIYSNFIGYIYVKRNNSILTSTYSKQRLDAFIGWDEILDFFKNNYPELYSEVSACFAYNLVDHIYYILNQVADKEVKEKYLYDIRGYVRKYYKQILINEKLTTKYKIIISILKSNVKLLIFTNNMKSSI